MTPRAYSYIRFSSAAQGAGDSLRRQSALAEEWCRANDVSLVEDYRDLGVSAFRRKNETDGALAAFLAGVEDGRIPPGSYLLVESLDRVSRAEVEKAMSLFLQIINAGIVIVTLADGHVYRSGRENMMIDLMYSLLIMSRAHEESMTKSRRLSSAWSRKRQELAESGKPLTAKGPSWLRLEGDKWVEIPEKVAVVREVFQMSASGMSLNAIMRDLNRRKIPTPAGKKVWGLSSVVNLIESRAPLGEFSPKIRDGSKSSRVRTLVRRDYFPQIISPDLYSRARRNNVNEASMRGRKSPNVFRGLLFDKDGKPFHYHAGSEKTTGKRGYLRTFDPGREQGGWKSWRYLDFLHEFLEALDAHVAAPDDGPLRLARLDSVRAALAKKEGEIQNLVEALAGGYSKAIENALREAERAQGELESELALLTRPSSPSAPLREITDVAELSARIRSSVVRITMDVTERTWWAELVGGGRISRT